jgi:serine protease AprX
MFEYGTRVSGMNNGGKVHYHERFLNILTAELGVCYKTVHVVTVILFTLKGLLNPIHWLNIDLRADKFPVELGETFAGHCAAMLCKKLLPASALLFFAALASAQDANPERKIDRALRASLHDGSRTQRIIITIAPGCRATMGDALRKHGDRITAEHPLIDALSAQAHSEDVEELAKHPCVKAVSADADVTADASRWLRNFSFVGSADAMPNVLRETLGLPRVAGSSTVNGGTGLGVAIVDSGIAPSIDFLGRIQSFYDFTRGGIQTTPYDDFGHGTHIAGLMASSGALSNHEYQGVAPALNIHAFKVLDGRGKGKTSDVISALEFITANRTKLNVQIVNLALGHPIYAPGKDDPLVQAVERASAAGLIVVVSAGNNGAKRESGEIGYTGITSPGNARSAITVGAATTQGTVGRRDDAIAPYSSSGPTWFDAYAKPDIAAPGHRLASDTSLTSYLYRNLPTRRMRSATGQLLLELNGTSMATAVTSGVVALVLQQHNQNGLHRQKPLTPNLVKAILQFSAVPVEGAGYLTQGAGQINAAGAISLAKAIDTSTGPGEWWLASSVLPYSTIGGETSSWSQHVIYNERVLTGDLLYYNSTAWSAATAWDTDNIIWGTRAFVDADNIIWGTSSVWAANLVWSDRVVGLDDGDDIIWGTDEDNIIWGTLSFDNIIWGTWDEDNVIWGTWDGDDIIWGTDDNIIWGTHDHDGVIWGTWF